jgi:hypothetical protein
VTAGCQPDPRESDEALTNRHCRARETCRPRCSADRTT